MFTMGARADAADLKGFVLASIGLDGIRLVLAVFGGTIALHLATLDGHEVAIDILRSSDSGVGDLVAPDSKARSKDGLAMAVVIDLGGLT